MSKKYIIIDFLKVAMLPVLRHRIITNFSAEAEGITSVEVINKLGELEQNSCRTEKSGERNKN